MANAEFGVLFDVDGVLIDSYAAHLKTWQICCRRIGRECTEQQFAAGFGRTSREVIRDTWTDPPGDEEIRRFDEEKEQLYRDLIADDFPWMPGAAELITALHAARIPMAIGSSAPPKNVDVVLDKMNLRNIITTVITGADVERGKPHPDVFLKGAVGIGLPPNRCIVLEDAPPGIEAGLAAGCKVLGIVSRGRTIDQLHRAHDRVMHDLRAVTPGMLAKLIES